MTLTDLLLLAAVLLFGVAGYHRGFVGQVLSLVGVALGVLLGALLGPHVLPGGSELVPVASVVGAFYYLRIVKIMYFDEPLIAFDRPLTPELKAVLVVAAVLTMAFIVWPDPIVGGAEAAAAALFPR